MPNATVQTARAVNDERGFRFSEFWRELTTERDFDTIRWVTRLLNSALDLLPLQKLVVAFMISTIIVANRLFFITMLPLIDSYGGHYAAHWCIGWMLTWQVN